MINFAFTAEVGVLGSNCDTVGLNAAITAAFADRRIDENAFLNLRGQIALAPTTQFGGTHLVIDKYGRALGGFQFRLSHSHLIAVIKSDPGRHLGVALPALGVRANHDNTLDTFTRHLLRDRNGMQFAINVLPSRHSDGVIVENFVGDIDLGCDRLADRQQPRMEISAVA